MLVEVLSPRTQVPSADPPSASPRPAPQAQTLGKDGLEHHLDLYARLVDRRAEAPAYRAILEEVLGFSLRQAVVSTSEHAAPFNHASAVSYALPQLALQYSGRCPPARIVILVGTLVPFDNRHYPRGFLLEDDRRFNLFTQRVSKSCPMLQPPASVEGRKESRAFLETYPWLAPYLTGATSFPDAGHQMSAIMEAMAARWFDAQPSPVAIRSLEEVARRILIRLLAARDPWLDRLLFDRAARASVAQSLTGTFCAWGARHGSFLFWERRGDRLGRFVEEDGCLVGEGSRVPLTRDALLSGLETNAILPGVFVSLLATSYLPGLAVAGGPKQPDYYRAMIRAANDVGGLRRGEELSTYGYWSVDMNRVTPSPADPQPIPKEGAGLSLTTRPCDAEWICGQLAGCPVLPIPPRPSYD
jgi:hypothetical protein